MKQIWLEKYRPKVLNEVEGNEKTIQHLKYIAHEGNVPHMILAVRNNHQILTFSIRDHPGLEKLHQYFA